MSREILCILNFVKGILKLSKPLLRDVQTRGACKVLREMRLAGRG